MMAIIATGTPEDFLKGRNAEDINAMKALDAMIEDERKAGPEYERLADTIVPTLDTPCKAKFVRLLMGEHAKDEQKHHDALVKLKEMM